MKLRLVTNVFVSLTQDCFNVTGTAMIVLNYYTIHETNTREVNAQECKSEIKVLTQQVEGESRPTLFAKHVSSRLNPFAIALLFTTRHMY